MAIICGSVVAVVVLRAMLGALISLLIKSRVYAVALALDDDTTAIVKED